MIYDVIIIGSGPAGLTASIYAKRAQLKSLVIEKAAFSGGQVINTYEVDNYPGTPGISGFDLSSKFREHSDKLGAEFITDEVSKLELDGEIKVLTLSDGKEYRAKAVIIATGGEARRLGVKGEEELAGAGVSYCATCDGAFFKDKVTAVIGGGDTAVEEAIFLSRICKKVYLIHRRDELRANKGISNKILETENVTILWDSVVEGIKGDGRVESLDLKNVKSGENTEVELEGVFIAVGYLPNSEAFKDVVDLDQNGYIVADETCQTSVPGIFAAGDIRTKELRQIVTAASDGANAITGVEKYLNNL